MWACRTAFALACLSSFALAGVGVAGEEHDYVGVEKCRTCHEKELMGDQLGTWSEGPHRRAYQSLLGEESAAIVERLEIEGPAQESDACLRCHLTAFGVSPLRIANVLAPDDGVQCESCHGPGRDYRKKKIMSDREKAEKKGLWNAGDDASICLGCHNPESPTFDLHRYRLPDGTTAGFDFEIAKGRIPHAIPEHVKGRFIELDEAEKAAKKAAREAE